MFDFFKKKKNEMFIFRLIDDEIFVMKLIPRDFDIIKYKQDILSKYTQEDLFMHLETDEFDTMKKFYYNKNLNNFNYKSGSWENHHYSNFTYICGKELNDEQKKLLHKYISGDYNDIKTYDEWDGSKCYLINTDMNCFDVRGKTDYYKHPIYKSDNIINLPKELYLLHLLSEGKYEELVNEDVSEQLSLFDLEYVTSFKIKDYKKLISKNFIKDNESFAIEKVRNSDFVFTKSRKIN